MKNENRGRERGREKAAALPLPPPKTITHLGEIEDICGAPLEVSLMVRGKAVAFTGRRLTPAESRETKLILDQTLPPVLREEGKEPVYNFADPGYKKQKEQSYTQGRALAIWMGFPIFKEQAERENIRLASTVEIAKWMGQRKLDDDVLEALFDALTNREVDLYLGFTSGDSSPTS